MGALMLLDTSTLMYRGYKGPPPSIRDDMGNPVNAVHIYLDWTAKLINTYGPDRVIHVRNHTGRPAARITAYPGYKATRDPTPEELVRQVALLGTVLAALGAEIAVAPGWEADDAIATLCAEANEGERVDIVTLDHDLLELVRDASPQVRVLFMVRGGSVQDVFDEARVLARYDVPPSRYADFAILRGNPGDELPGVPGIGPADAARLVAKYPSLDALLEDSVMLPTKLVRRLSKARAYLEAMREVVPLRRDVLVETRQHSRNDDVLRELAESGGLGNPIGRIREAMGTLQGGWEQASLFP